MKRLITLFMILLLSSTFSYASLNSPKRNGFKIYKNEIYKASIDANISMEELVPIISFESGFNPKSKNKEGSSAKGMFAYINSSWKTDKKRFGNQAGVKHNASVLDPKSNIRIGAYSLSHVKKRIIRETKLDHNTITTGDLYMAHLLGEDKAIKVLKGNPNSKITNYIKLGKGNKRLFVKNGKVLTVKQFRFHLNQLMEKELAHLNNDLNDFQLTKLIEDLEKNQWVYNSINTNSIII